MRLGMLGTSSLLAASSLLVCWLAGIRLNLSGSMPRGIYQITHGTPVRGAIVLVCLPPRLAMYAHQRRYVPNGSCPDGSAPIGKPIIASGGDTVVVAEDGVRIGGRLVLYSKPLSRDGKGRLLLHVPIGTYVVRPNEIWLLSTHSERSFDSRYFGAVPLTGVVAIVRPIVAQ